MSLKLSEDDFSNLCNKYTNSTNGLINYRAFTAQLENGMSIVCVWMCECECVCVCVCVCVLIVCLLAAFDPDILDGKPQEQIVAFQRYLLSTVGHCIVLV